MIHLDDLLDPVQLAAMLDAGYVRVQRHPTLPLRIYNYTNSTQYDRVWNDVTRQCRGLIVDDADVVFARPWPKFFNYGEHEEGTLDLSEPAAVTNKLDGSLGILYRTGSGCAIATRGSFTSEQAIVGTELLQPYLDLWTPHADFTYLFEIIYPENRIVVDYQGASDLVLLDILETATGRQAPEEVWMYPGSWVESLDATTLAAALALEPRPNAEGVVVRLEESGTLVKLKQDDYVALHKLVTGLNARAVWERMGAGESVGGICAALPDEFHAFVRTIGDELVTQALRVAADVSDTYESIVTGLVYTGQLPGDGPNEWTRKDFALEAVKYPHIAPHLFAVLDGKDPSAAIWHRLRPSSERTLLALTEDNA